MRDESKVVEAETVESPRGYIKCHDIELGDLARNWEDWKYQSDDSNLILIEASSKTLSKSVSVICFPISHAFLFNWMYSLILPGDTDSFPPVREEGQHPHCPHLVLIGVQLCYQHCLPDMPGRTSGIYLLSLWLIKLPSSCLSAW